jgi:hypothetical protein
MSYKGRRQAKKNISIKVLYKDYPVKVLAVPLSLRVEKGHYIRTHDYLNSMALIGKCKLSI